MAWIELQRDGRPLYRFRYNYGRDPVTGKKIWDEKESRDEAKLRAFAASVTPVTTSTSDRVTVHELIELWRAAHDPETITGRERPWGQRTSRDREQQTRLRIRPFLGRDRVTALTPQRVEEWIAWMLQPVDHASDDGSRVMRSRFGPNAARKSLQDLKACIRWGRGRGIVENVYIDDVRGISTPPPKPPSPLKPSEVKRVMDACEYLRDATLIAVGAYSGMRWSELRGLQWGDLSDDLHGIHVQRSVDWDGSFKLPKHDKTRTAALLKRGRDAIERYRGAIGGRPDDALVFPGETGKPLRSNWYERRLAPIRAASGIHLQPHQLRDTYASILISTREITPEQLTLWMGHSDVSVTLRRYARLYEAHKVHLSSAADAMVERLG